MTLSKTKQAELVRNKQVRAVPGGYYTGLISDMHEDLRLYQEKNLFTPIRSSFSSVHPSSSPSSTEHFSHDEIFQMDKRNIFDHMKTPLIYSLASIRFTLPTCLTDLTEMSALDFLISCSDVIHHRKQIIWKLLRKWPNDLSMEINEMKDFLFDYLNGSEKRNAIDEYFDFLEIRSPPSYPLKSVLVRLCAYAERYFYLRSQTNDSTLKDNARPLQETIDLEFLKRKLDGMILTQSLERLLETLRY